MTFYKRTPELCLIWVRPYSVLTPSKRNFLRVNAQMHNLDKQKTTPAWKTLAVMFKKT